ncbi:cytochrome P450 [Pestalotiopsis sp. NC0098]|nr:cytochrome P450 [Pestalotiopsis sp. NC0098]
MSAFATVIGLIPAILGFILSLGLCLCAYEILLHPLKNYPGPLVAKFTDGYAGYFAIKKRLHLVTYRGHLKYGPVYRQAPNRLVFNTSAALRDIYLNPGVGKAQIYRHTQFDVHTNIFGELDRERHRQKRKIYGNVLSERSLRAFEPCMAREVDVFLGQLLRSAAKAVNVSPLCRHLTADVAGQLAFGQPLRTQTEEAHRIFPRAMVSMNAIVNIFMSWPVLKKAWPLIRRFNKKNGLAFSQAIRSIVNKRKALPKDARHDFFSLVPTDADSLEESLKSTELWAEAIFFLPAGGTTLAAALSAVFFYLSRHPRVYVALAAEIRTCFASGHDITMGPRLAGCAYLRATLDETLRVAPPFTGTFWREPFSDHAGAPFVVDGRAVPRGTIVGVNPYCVMHNEE